MDFLMVIMASSIAHGHVHMMAVMMMVMAELGNMLAILQLID